MREVADFQLLQGPEVHLQLELVLGRGPPHLDDRHQLVSVTVVRFVQHTCTYVQQFPHPSPWRSCEVKVIHRHGDVTASTLPVQDSSQSSPPLLRSPTHEAESVVHDLLWAFKVSEGDDKRSGVVPAQTQGAVVAQAVPHSVTEHSWETDLPGLRGGHQVQHVVLWGWRSGVVLRAVAACRRSVFVTPSPTLKALNPSRVDNDEADDDDNDI